jgi:hypothetical protein
MWPNRSKGGELDERGRRHDDESGVIEMIRAKSGMVKEAVLELNLLFGVE